MMPEPVTFADLRRVLEGLGFREVPHPSGALAFEHSPSDTLFLFRRHRPEERVAPTQLLMVRRILDERGLLGADAFEDLLPKAPA